MGIKSKIIKLYKVLTKKSKIYVVDNDKNIIIEPKIDFEFLQNKLETCKNDNTSFYKTVVSCSGAGFSGSSAVTDFLAEFDNCTALGGSDFSDRDKVLKKV